VRPNGEQLIAVDQQAMARVELPDFRVIDRIELPDETEIIPPALVAMGASDRYALVGKSMDLVEGHPLRVVAHADRKDRGLAWRAVAYDPATDSLVALRSDGGLEVFDGRSLARKGECRAPVDSEHPSQAALAYQRNKLDRTQAASLRSLVTRDLEWGLGAGEGAAWVVNDSGEVSRVDLRTFEIRPTAVLPCVPIGPTATSVDGSWFVATGSDISGEIGSVLRSRTCTVAVVVFHHGVIEAQGTFPFQGTLSGIAIDPTKRTVFLVGDGVVAWEF
jgi:hypothetical protein